jgi:hypothetical protein
MNKSEKISVLVFFTLVTVVLLLLEYYGADFS